VVRSGHRYRQGPAPGRHAGIDLDVPGQALKDSAASSAFIRDNLGALLAGD
jgi:hypothetical protein